MSSLLFHLDSRLSKPFYSPTFDVWLENFHRESKDGSIELPITMEDYEKLSDADKHALNEQYLAYKKSIQEDKREEAWNAYKYF